MQRRKSSGLKWAERALCASIVALILALLSLTLTLIDVL
jgi:hypothetical protein